MAKKKQSFPLWFHAGSGQWAKQINGKRQYFGTEKDEALQKFKQFQDSKTDPKTIDLAEGCNRFLSAKNELMLSEQFSPRTFADYKSTCKRLINILGRSSIIADLGPSEFLNLLNKLSETRNPISLGNELTRAKTVFKWLYDNDFLDKPVKFGSDFKKPTRRLIRQHKFEKGKKLLTQDEIRLLINEAGIHLKAMVYLGINAGFGNSDCSNLPRSAIDFKTGILDWYRPKTGIDRRAILWPETIEALKESFKWRPKPSNSKAKERFFVFYNGEVWIPDDSSDNIVSKWTTGILKRLKIHRKEMSFYWLRHTYRTRADEVKDQPAAMFTMGHTDETMSGNYRQEISDDRLRAISDYVWNWLNQQ